MADLCPGEAKKIGDSVEFGGIWRLECFNIYLGPPGRWVNVRRVIFSSVIPDACSQFSLMQFSEDFQIHFTFNEFKKNPKPSFLVKSIKQLLGRTHTATGIRKVV